MTTCKVLPSHGLELWDMVEDQLQDLTSVKGGCSLRGHSELRGFSVESLPGAYRSQTVAGMNSWKHLNLRASRSSQ